MRIGCDVLLGTPANFNYTNPKKILVPGQVIPANHKITEVHIGWNHGNGTNSGNIKTCLYDEGVVATNKPKLSGTEVSVPYSSASLGTGPKWVSLTGLDINVSVHAGKAASVGIAPPINGTNSGFAVLLGEVTGATRFNSATSSINLPDPYASNGSVANQAWSVFYVLEPIGGVEPDPTIDSLGDAGTVRVGQSVAITTTGLGTLTSATIGGKVAASIAAPGGDGTVILADFVDGETYPAMGTAVVTVGDGAKTATKSDAVLSTFPGWQWVNVSSLSAGEFSLANAFGEGDTPTQLHVINDGVGVLNADGTLTNWPVGTFTCWARMAAGTWAAGTMKTFTFTVHEPVNLEGGDLTVELDFTSPLIIPDVMIAPQDWVVTTDIDQPGISSDLQINPHDWSVAADFSEPGISSEAHVAPADWGVAIDWEQASIVPIASISPDDLAVGVSYSSPLIGDVPVGPFRSSHVVKVMVSKMIVSVKK